MNRILLLLIATCISLSSFAQSLYTGAKPYRAYYGDNITTSGNHSKIEVKAPENSDVVVLIKRYGEVVSHAYIAAYGSYTFYLPNGMYQPFFYYGKEWNSNKIIKSNGKTLRGGFESRVTMGKDSPQSLQNNILTYELILQQNGNFSTTPTNENEMF